MLTNKKGIEQTMPSTVKANDMKKDTDMKIETGVLITGIKLKYPSKNKMHMVRIICFKDWMKNK